MDSDGFELLQLMERTQVNLIIMMADFSGIKGGELAKIIREIGATCPIVMMLAHGEVYHATVLF